MDWYKTKSDAVVKFLLHIVPVDYHMYREFLKKNYDKAIAEFVTANRFWIVSHVPGVKERAKLYELLDCVPLGKYPWGFHIVVNYDKTVAGFYNRTEDDALFARDGARPVWERLLVEDSKKPQTSNMVIVEKPTDTKKTGVGVVVVSFGPPEKWDSYQRRKFIRLRTVDKLSWDEIAMKIGLLPDDIEKAKDIWESGKWNSDENYVEKSLAKYYDSSYAPPKREKGKDLIKESCIDICPKCKRTMQKNGFASIGTLRQGRQRYHCPTCKTNSVAPNSSVEAEPTKQIQAGKRITRNTKQIQAGKRITRNSLTFGRIEWTDEKIKQFYSLFSYNSMEYVCKEMNISKGQYLGAKSRVRRDWKKKIAKWPKPNPKAVLPEFHELQVLHEWPVGRVIVPLASFREMILRWFKTEEDLDAEIKDGALYINGEKV